jgi:hypothetical protein
MASNFPFRNLFPQPHKTGHNYHYFHFTASFEMVLRNIVSKLSELLISELEGGEYQKQLWGCF